MPQAFAREEFPVIRRLVEIILGEDLKSPEETPVPGAPATIYDEVAEWIDLVVASAPAVRAQALSLPVGPARGGGCLFRQRRAAPRT